MKKRFMLLGTVLLFVMPFAAWADLSEMNDLELKNIRGTEGLGGENVLESVYTDSEENLMALDTQLFFDQLENDQQIKLLTEFKRGMKEGTIKMTDVKLSKDGASFDFIFDKFESEQMANTDSVGFNKQYLNHRTIIDGQINHSFHN